MIIVKIVKKRRIQENSRENLIVHNLFITSDLSKIFNKKTMVDKHPIFEPRNRKYYFFS
jgi:hypothetical protein